LDVGQNHTHAIRLQEIQGLLPVTGFVNRADRHAHLA
jgi:hypothetical protein